jgi:uncharacterized integral membrane protein
MSEVTVRGHRIRVTGRRIIGAVVGIVALVFILQNSNDVHVDFFFWNFDLPLFVWGLLVFGGGFVVGSFFPWFHRSQRTGAAVSGPAAPISPQQTTQGLTS